MTNYEKFVAELTKQYQELFTTPDYKFAALRHTPESLAKFMSDGLRADQANKDGTGIKNTCKALKIKYTYCGIATYLNS